MADLTIVAADVRPVRIDANGLFSGPADEAILPGQAVRFATATGRFTKANGTAAGEARLLGIALTEATAAGDIISVLAKGILDLGDAIDALTYDDDVFLSDTDGTLGDVAGTVSVIAGTVVPGWGATTPDKLLRIDR